MNRRSWSLLAALVALMVLGSACSTSTPARTELTVFARDFKFEPKNVELKKGQPVRIIFHNQDLVVHDWVVLKIPFRDRNEQSDGGHRESPDPETSIHVSAEVGRMGTVDFTPLQAGKYAIICSIAGHTDVGMKGSLTVR